MEGIETDFGQVCRKDNDREPVAEAARRPRGVEKYDTALILIQDERLQLSAVHAQTPIERCAELGRANRLAGSLPSPNAATLGDPPPCIKREILCYCSRQKTGEDSCASEPLPQS